MGLQQIPAPQTYESLPEPALLPAQDLAWGEAEETDSKCCATGQVDVEGTQSRGLDDGPQLPRARRASGDTLPSFYAYPAVTAPCLSLPSFPLLRSQPRQAQRGRSRPCNPPPYLPEIAPLDPSPASPHLPPLMTDTSSQFLLPVASSDSYNTSIPRCNCSSLSPGVLAGIVLGGPDADPPHRSGCVLPGSAGPSGARGCGG